MAMASSAAAPSAVGRSSTSTCSWRPHWWSCANSFNGHASAIAGRLARLPGASNSAYCRALLAQKGQELARSEQWGKGPVDIPGARMFRPEPDASEFGVHELDPARDGPPLLDEWH